MKAPPPLTTHNGSTYPSYNSVNSSTFQAMAAPGMHGQVIVNDAQLVINDTSIMMIWMKSYQSSTIWVRKWPVWSIIFVVNNLCGRWPVWTITHIVYLYVGKIFHLCEVSSVLVSICVSSTCQGLRFIIFEHHLVMRSKLSVGCN